MKQPHFKFIASLALSAALALGALTGCGPRPAAGPSETTAAGPTETAAAATAAATAAAAAESTAGRSETVVFTDSCGREVEIPTNLTRVAPSGTVAQMVLYSIAPDALIGWSKTPPADTLKYMGDARLDLPEFGQFYGKNVSLNMEALIAAEPQVIIDIGDMKKTHKEDMDGIQEQTGIPTIFIEATLETFPEAYRTLGKLLNQPERAERQAAYIEKTVEDARTKAAGIAEADRKTVYFGVGEEALNCNAKGSVQADVIELIGAENAVVVEEVSNKGGGTVISFEELIQLDPDVIILTDAAAYDRIGSDEAWQTLSAVKNNTYYQIPGEPYSWMSSPPSVNRLLGIRWLGRLLYPNVYTGDMIAEAKTFYNLFWHYDLTDAEAEALMANSIGKMAK